MHDMLDALKFVRGAVARKDYEPALTHFRIHEGRVLGYNGVVALSSPIDLDVDACPQGVAFVRAIERCKGATTVVHMTPSGRLSLKSGNFQAYIPCHDDSDVLDAIRPEGVGAEFAGSALNAMRALEPFIGTDASRPWGMGVLLRDYSAYATNNVVLAQYWIGQGMPNVNLPAMAVRELLRIGQEPIAAQVSDRTITFFFEGDRWMRTQLYSVDWPDLTRILDQPFSPKPFPPGLFDAVETLIPFVDETGRVYFRGDRITTCGVGEGGATVEIENVPAAAAFHHSHLLSLRGIADQIDFDPYPNPCGFLGLPIEGVGRRLRGAIIGMRDV